MIIISVVLAFFIGLYLYRISSIEEQIDNFEVAKTNVTSNGIANLIEPEEIQTTQTEEKITPNTNIVIKTYYQNCKHMQTEEDLPAEKEINLNEEEFKEKHKDYEIQKFTSEEVILYKEVDDYCHEHYKLKEQNGYIIIYEINNEGEEIGVYKETDIETKYLPDIDRENLEKGITVYTRIELNKQIEDFE